MASGLVVIHIGYHNSELLVLLIVVLWARSVPSFGGSPTRLALLCLSKACWSHSLQVYRLF